MTYHVDSGHGANPHVNYEPTSRAARRKSPPAGADHTSRWSTGKVVRQEISRTNNYGQAGDRYRTFEHVGAGRVDLESGRPAQQCNQDIQERMVWHFSQCDAEYGQRVADGPRHRRREGAGGTGGDGTQRLSKGSRC